MADGGSSGHHEASGAPGGSGGCRTDAGTNQPARLPTSPLVLRLGEDVPLSPRSAAPHPYRPAFVPSAVECGQAVSADATAPIANGGITVAAATTIAAPTTDAVIAAFAASALLSAVGSLPADGCGAGCVGVNAGDDEGTASDVQLGNEGCADSPSSGREDTLAPGVEGCSPEVGGPPRVALLGQQTRLDDPARPPTPTVGTLPLVAASKPPRRPNSPTHSPLSMGTTAPRTPATGVALPLLAPSPSGHALPLLPCQVVMMPPHPRLPCPESHVDRTHPCPLAEAKLPEGTNVKTPAATGVTKRHLCSPLRVHWSMQCDPELWCARLDFSTVVAVWRVFTPRVVVRMAGR